MSATFNASKLWLFILMGAGLLFAWFAGNYVADEDYTPIAAVLGILIVISIVFGLGKSIYILIPICWGLTGKISVLPLPFNVIQLLSIFATGIFFTDLIFKRSMKKMTFEMIDLWVAINLLYILIGYFRNPVGVAALGGSELVGGKPYINLILGCMVYFILSRYRVTPQQSTKIPKWVLAITSITMFAGAVGTLLPSVGLQLMSYYSDFAPSDFSGSDNQQDVYVGETRLAFLTVMGLQLIRYIVAKINPTQLLAPRYFGELLLYIMGLVMIMLSGFRTGVINVLATTFLSAFLRERVVGVAKIMFVILSIALIAVSLSHTNLKLPLTFQRAFSFLPGDWDKMALEDAKDSSEWRYEMWRMALTSDKYIRNKILGDGFGFLRVDFERGVQMMLGRAELNQSEAKQEMFLLDGDYHSGPVGAIRFVGYLGLVLLLPLFYLSITYALRLIRRSEGSPYMFCVLFFSLPTIIFPFFFLFVFGDYRTGIVDLLFNIGMLKMLSSSLEEFKKRSETSKGIIKTSYTIPSSLQMGSQNP